ncbi:chromosome partitioning protein ParA [Candidatus Kuenenbacteria bacterium HGW-Kuenenbacteria-1]|uniref:Chromosome partitioning protein ParA n=1 Tax=Candidatus Kuenenbacteria bacterium HGW-Kuenenbacteria-1 TaxID=2013812 RepID=A0A2N1UPF3_9BACT|nr:MAG: chromosome partitioning protein ParA [Candidatus Kuenenbacteria bacterium HGW-Kuenenbacteria-1]
MCKIISIVNQKGGVGKTTTAVNLGAFLAKLGKSVLLIDFDPQGNASSGTGIECKNKEKGVYEVLIGKKIFKEIIQPTFFSNYYVAPSNESLAGATIELINLKDREFCLAKAILEIKNNYDYIIIDCPPSLCLLTINALMATDKILIPVQAEYYALEGLAQLLKTINLVQKNLKPELEILGAVITMYDKRNKLSEAVLQELHQHFPYKIFQSIIPRSVRLAEAPSFGQTILQFDPISKGAEAYEKLAMEILDAF